MKLAKDLSGEYRGGIEEYVHFEELESDDDGSVLFYGYASGFNKSLKEEYKNYAKKISYNGVQPCSHLSGDTSVISVCEDHENYFDSCYTVCPYTAEWINGRIGRDKFKLCNFTYNTRYAIKSPVGKQYSVLYWGGLHSDVHRQIIDGVSKFENYNFFTISPHHWYPNQENGPYVEKITGLNVPRDTMYEVIKRTKIVVVANQIFPIRSQAENIKKLDGWSENKAFNRIDELVIPQWKTRVIETAFNGSLPLVLRDSWNVIENWFIPDEDFVYFDSVEELPDKINELLSDPNRCNRIATNIYHKVMNNYTTQHTWEKFKKDE